MKYKRAGFLISAALLMIGGGCVSLAETGGKVLDGSAFAEKTLASYQEEPGGKTRLDRVHPKDGPEFIAIRFDSMPNLRITGSLPDGEGNFYLSSLYFLSPNTNGWNEFTLELSGSGSFVSSDAAQTGALLQLKGPVETLDIREGKIRRGASRLTGAQALTALHNRQERIEAITLWMKEQPGLPDFLDRETFEEYWTPLLFPEIVKQKKRPAAWTEGESWVLGEDVKWNSVYTKSVFPEDLWPVRNSGTLLRDWEEASGWIYFAFEWDHIVASLSETIELKKIK
ncbi:hypothetical protein [Treponema primitia]|uniref:hypothetical protein n=1 Tax=Treponema primitia TaxID=88058 RepID=UPI000255559A|nr:hypothetical protein [Treponema primitia]